MNIRQLRGWLMRLFSLFNRKRHEREFAAELESHLAFHIEDNLRAGMLPEEARRVALIKLGGVAVTQELHREQRGVPMLETLWQDLRFGLRMLRKNPGFSFVAILTLALGIGANTAILSVVNSIILRPMPVEKPDELVMTFWGSKKDAEVWGGFSYANYKDLREQNQSLAGLLAWAPTSAGISDDSTGKGDSSRAEVAFGELVSANYFDVLGVKPMLGRVFLPEEERTQNTHPVVVISERLWRERFKSDTGIAGKTIYLNGSPLSVIGVAPASFKGMRSAFRQAFWVPLMMSAKLGVSGAWETDRTSDRFRLLGRRKPGVTMAQVEADLTLVADSMARQLPATNSDTKVQVATHTEGKFYNIGKLMQMSAAMALGISLLVLLVVCANVANLLLARAAIRAREIGIRLAIGAGRGRLIRQLLTESMLLAGLGAALGYVFAYWGARVIEASLPPLPFPIDADFSPDKHVLIWMVVISVLTGVVFGLAPALAASRSDLVAVIKGGAAAQTRSRCRWNLRGALVVAQVAISIIVLICAGLFLRSLNRAVHLDPGLSVENLVTMRMNPGLLAYSEDKGKRFFAEAVHRIETLPGVRAVSLAAVLPLGVDDNTQGPVLKEGEPDPPPNQGIEIHSNIVAPNYFATLKTALVLGRDFTERDTQNAPPVVIVNQQFARKFYGSPENALGKRLRIGSNKEPLREIVGIAKDGLYFSLYEDPRPYLLLPEYQFYRSTMTLLVSAHSARDLPVIAENVRQTITQLDSRMPVAAITLAEANLAYAYWAPRLAAGLTSALGVFALLLATMGLYSVMTYAVAERTREIGIRMALGAQVRHVLRLVVSQGMWLVVVGLALGLLGAFALTRLLASLLLGISATDPLTFVGVAAVLLAIALLACWLPARRAAKADPMIALRHD